MGQSPQATQRQHEICVKILLENGADSNAVDIHQNTSLHYTVYNKDTTIAAKLLAFNADTEVKTKVTRSFISQIKRHLPEQYVGPFPHVEAESENSLVKKMV